MIDSRIGILNSGVHYAFINGYDAPEFRGTLEEVEIALGIREPSEKREVITSASNEDHYTVTMTFEYPAWDEKDGIVYEDIVACSKADAIRQARTKAFVDGHAISGRGRYWFTARLDD